MKSRPRLFACLLAAMLPLAGCDQIANRLGLEDPGVKEAKADGEGKAVGAACRQSGRAIEDCYSIYGWLPKASIFAGWRDMNDYMQSNKLEIVEPKLPPPGGPGKKRKVVEETAGNEKKPAETTAASDSKPAEKADARKEADKSSSKAPGKN